MGADAQLPWRGPGPGRPALPLPPATMPLWRAGSFRKRWRYLAAYGERVMLCAARVQIGPFPQSFWAVWDRERGRRHAHTRVLPGGRAVQLDGDVLRLDTSSVSADLRFAPSTAIEAVCPSGERGYGWTRKRAGMAVSGSVELEGRRVVLDGYGMEDVSAGYHARHTAWRWSAGVGTAADGRRLAWNLVTGINDPQRDSERAIWVDGTPHEPAPVEFDGLEGIGFESGAALRFSAESERARKDNLLLFRSRYRHLFGTFDGALDGIEMAEAFGVMEEHEAVW